MAEQAALESVVHEGEDALDDGELSGNFLTVAKQLEGPTIVGSTLDDCFNRRLSAIASASSLGEDAASSSATSSTTTMSSTHGFFGSSIAMEVRADSPEVSVEPEAAGQRQNGTRPRQPPTTPNKPGKRVKLEVAQTRTLAVSPNSAGTISLKKPGRPSHDAIMIGEAQVTMFKQTVETDGSGV